MTKEKNYLPSSIKEIKTNIKKRKNGKKRKELLTK